MDFTAKFQSISLQLHEYSILLSLQTQFFISNNSNIKIHFSTNGIFKKNHWQSYKRKKIVSICMKSSFCQGTYVCFYLGQLPTVNTMFSLCLELSGPLVMGCRNWNHTLNEDQLVSLLSLFRDKFSSHLSWLCLVLCQDLLSEFGSWVLFLLLFSFLIPEKMMPLPIKSMLDEI